MKNILKLASIILFIASCNQPNNSKQINSTGKDSNVSIKTDFNDSNELPLSIIAQIKEFYQKYHKDLNYFDLKIEEKKENGILELEYKGRYKKTDKEWDIISGVEIPLKNHPNTKDLEPEGYVIGDLNGDGLNDYFVRSNLTLALADDILPYYAVFINNNGAYEMKYMESGTYTENQGEYIGYFGPNRIENGVIIGLGLEAPEDNPGYPASETYEYRFIFDGKKLVQTLRKKIDYDTND